MELSEILFGSTIRSKSVVCCSLWKEGRNIAINQNYDQINVGQTKFKGNLSTMNQKCRHRFSSNFHFWTFNPPWPPLNHEQFCEIDKKTWKVDKNCEKKETYYLGSIKLNGVNGEQPKFNGNLSSVFQQFSFLNLQSSLAGRRGVSWADRQSISRPALHYGKFFDISS